MLSGVRNRDMSTTALHGKNLLPGEQDFSVGPQLLLLQNHMAGGLKGPFMETLRAVNILFLLGITTP